jgi:hypothetical protein
MSRSSEPTASPSLEELVGRTDAQLRATDPLAMNLAVARGLPALSGLDPRPYADLADGWADDLRRRLPRAELEFRRSPGDWKGDVHFFRLGLLCWYVDEVLGIRYREDQRDLRAVAYTDPCDLFVHGVMDSRRGTCGNMAALHMALGWRLGWPVSLACAGWHVLCRYDDGRVTHNIEATNNGHGGFHSHPDAYYKQRYGLDEVAVREGSDLAWLGPRALLGLFVGLRARHHGDCGRLVEAARDYRLARALFPQSWLFRRKAAELGRWS